MRSFSQTREKNKENNESQFCVGNGPIKLSVSVNRFVSVSFSVFPCFCICKFSFFLGSKNRIQTKNDTLIGPVSSGECWKWQRRFGERATRGPPSGRNFGG